MHRPFALPLTWAAILLMAWPRAEAVDAFPAAGHPQARQTAASLDGVWTIDVPPWPPGPGRCGAYLPPGTRVRLQVLGPNRLALEEGRPNELGGVLTLLPGSPPGICQTALGQQLGAGAACADEGAVRQREWRLDLDLTVERLGSKAMGEVDQAFLREQGAKAGARTVWMVAKEANVAWRLWLRHPREMVAQCVMAATDDEVSSVPMRWKRLPAGQ